MLVFRSEPPPVSFSDFEKRNRKRKLRRELRSYIESKRRTEEALLRSQNYKSKQENSGCWFAEFYTYMNQPLTRRGPIRRRRPIR
ncbi:hypothetical protein AB6A40_009427 [Gnathostoma spinigerum]|uniref:Uncharacterized protein n=1 Tax=Gnathostoma spinigerum TaxID=75299 RepID=A0ABD6ERZ1_9BILA